MNVLVTGGAGYIGSHAAALLVERGDQVTVLDSLEKGHREAVHPSARLIEGNVSDGPLLDRLLGETPFDAVMHFAAYIEAGESMRAPERFFVNNTANTLQLIDRLMAHGPRRLIFSSTAATYGAPEYTPIDENHPQAPTNAYGYSKLLVEGALEWMHRLRGLSYASLRYFNAAGCGLGLGEDHAPETHLIPLVLDAALGRRRQAEIFGADYPTPDGTCIRDYIHVLDLAQAHLLALDALGASQQAQRLIYNLGNGQGHSVREVIAVAEKVSGRSIPVVESQRRAGDPAVLIASSEKIRRELGWQPEHADLVEIIGSAWQWRQGHPAGYAKSS